MGRDGDVSREVDQYFTLDGTPLFKHDPCHGEPATLDVEQPKNFSEECREYIGVLLNTLEEEGERELTVEGDTLKRAMGCFERAVDDRAIFEQKLLALAQLGIEGFLIEYDETEGKWSLTPAEEIRQLKDSDPKLYDLVGSFSYAMSKDLLQADQEGKTGWGDEDERDFFIEEIRKHVAQGRWIGAANFCMFLHHLDEEKKDADQADAGGSPDDS